MTKLQDRKKSIRIYNSGGALPMCAHASHTLMQEIYNTNAKDKNVVVRDIDALEIRSRTSNWQNNTSALIFSGGAVTGFKQALKDDGVSAIKDYVQNGGTYVGFCAGAYFGASEIEFKGYDWQSKAPYERSGEGLGFFNGLARGSIGKIAPLYDGTSATCCATHVTLDIPNRITRDFPPIMSAFYGGGPEFITTEHPALDDPKCDVISHYILEDGDRRVAGLSCNVGPNGGKAILLSWHPDLNAHYLRTKCNTRFKDPGDNRQHIADEMDQFNSGENISLPWLKKLINL
jgi:biotin--protein ligase